MIQEEISKPGVDGEVLNPFPGAAGEGSAPGVAVLTREGCVHPALCRMEVGRAAALGSRCRALGTISEPFLQCPRSQVTPGCSHVGMGLVARLRWHLMISEGPCDPSPVLEPGMILCLTMFVSGRE